MSGWTPEHWLLVFAFFGMVVLCAMLLVRKPTVSVAGMPPHDMAGRMQLHIAENEQRWRDVPKIRDVKQIEERIAQLERASTMTQSDVRALRESGARIERQLDMLIQAGLDREKGETV